MENRAIRFRAWDVQERKFIDAVALGSLVYEVIVNPSTDVLDPNNFVLMQFTGLLDKNGVEAYFGDVCDYIDQSGTRRTGVIKDYGYFSGYIEAIGGDDEGNQDVELHPDNEFEIIGNIFESPELVK